MSSCCGPEKVMDLIARRCPQSGSVGSAVGRQTVKALLTENALRRLAQSEYRFCADPDCGVVYFDADGTTFLVEDLRVPVWQKLPFGSRLVCYCFGESEATVREEFVARGASLAADRIHEHIAAGRCACEVRNPRGTCCLGDIVAAVKQVEQALGRQGTATHHAGSDVA